jgi:cob(I)alamin adenosyltransferase
VAPHRYDPQGPPEAHPGGPSVLTTLRVSVSQRYRCVVDHRHSTEATMPFYTRTGDQGYTDLLGGRVPKYDARPETFGTIDEATSVIGFARAVALSPRTKRTLVEVQRDLYVMMAELAFTADMRQGKYHITAEHLLRIERETDELEQEVELPPHFILPGDSAAGAALDVARTVIRRAERHAVKLAHDGEIDNEFLLAYLNRLSSLLFVLGRFEDREAGVTPTKAKSEKRVE